MKDGKLIAFFIRSRVMLRSPEVTIVIKRTIYILTTLIILNSCTNRDLYKSFQPDRSSCIKLPTAQRDNCEKKINEQMTYDEYSAERKKL